MESSSAQKISLGRKTAFLSVELVLSLLSWHFLFFFHQFIIFVTELLPVVLERNWGG